MGENPAPEARFSLAQHGAEGGVLGKMGNGPESRRDGRGCDTVSSGPLRAGGKIVAKAALNLNYS